MWKKNNSYEPSNADLDTTEFSPESLDVSDWLAEQVAKDKTSEIDREPNRQSVFCSIPILFCLPNFNCHFYSRAQNEVKGTIILF